MSSLYTRDLIEDSCFLHRRGGNFPAMAIPAVDILFGLGVARNHFRHQLATDLDPLFCHVERPQIHVMLAGVVLDFLARHLAHKALGHSVQSVDGVLRPGERPELDRLNHR